MSVSIREDMHADQDGGQNGNDQNDCCYCDDHVLPVRLPEWVPGSIIPGLE